MAASVSKRMRTFRVYWPLLSKYVWPQRRLICVLAALLFATVGLQLAVPLILKHFIDVASTKGPLATLFALAVAYLCTALVQRFVTVGETYTAERVAWNATNALRVDAARHCLQLDLAFHHKHTPGELIERIDGDISLLNNLFSRFALVIVGNALWLIGMLVILTRIDLRIGGAMLVYATIFLLVLIRTGGMATPFYVKARQADAELFGFLEERLSGTEDIRANGAVGYVLRRFTTFLHKRRSTQVRAEVVAALLSSIRIFLYTSGTVVTFLLVGILYKNGSLQIGTAYVVYTYVEQLGNPLKAITLQLGDFQQALAGLSRLNTLMETQPTLVDGPQTQLPMGALAVDFEQMSFGYQQGEPVLHDVNFQLAPGKVLGILGRTGSGKTTLTRLLLRFYDPDQGTIRLNGIDLKAVRTAAIRSRVALVTQDVQLFHASVRDNLTFFDATVPDSKILAALETLGLREWYGGLPHGLDTMLASHGASLSAGQAQLVALTRVFLRDPDLVILDEASSRLDPATEEQLDRAIAGLLHHRTGMIIAHRLSTLKRVDEIMVLAHGRISEYGTRAQLENDPTSHYQRLLATGKIKEVTT